MSDQQRCGECRWFARDLMEDGPYGLCGNPEAHVNPHGTTREHDGNTCPCFERKETADAS